MFDENLSNRVLYFFHKFLRHTVGRWYGKPFELIPWQEVILRTVFGTVNSEGKRIYKKIFCKIPKKNGKSEFCSGLALYGLTGMNERGAEVYSSAGDREQASIIFDTAIKMIKMDRNLTRLCKVKESTKRIIVPKYSNKYKVLSSETLTKHGLNPSINIIDELHVVTRELFEVLTQGSTAAREEPLTIMLTTAGNDKNTICYEEEEYAKKILDGSIKDPSYLPIIFEVEEKEDWTSEENWKKANPSVGYTITIEGLREEFNLCKNRPSLEASFRRLRLNQWVSTHSKWLNVLFWDKTITELDIEVLKKLRCLAALDLSSTTDLTSLSLFFPFEENGTTKYYTFRIFWCPLEQVMIRVKRDKLPYDVWVRKGFIKTTPGNSIDHPTIKADIFRLNNMFDIEQLNVDPWNTSQLVSDLQDGGIKIAYFRQGFRSMSTPAKEYEVQILKGNILHDGNPVMRWMIDNVIIETDAAGNIKPDKKKSKEKIDGVVSDIMALDGCLRLPYQKSVYDSGGVKSV